MILIHDPQSADYGNATRPEQPARVTRTAEHLKSTHPDWTWRLPAPAAEEILLSAHTRDHLVRLQRPIDFDSDTPYFPGIYDHARRAAGAALEAMHLALNRQSAFCLMRPPGHHATADQAMGFCYLNQVAVAALQARHEGVGRIAVWDFDAHHGNGTEALLAERENFLYVSVHQHPAYPGTGAQSFGNCRNFPVEPYAPREQHQEALKQSWHEILSFRPELLLVSAGFDAYAGDPLTQMTLEPEDFVSLGQWLQKSHLPVASVLEGGYSPDLPILVEGFLTGWNS